MRGVKMLYKMEKIGRTVELNDELVSMYLKTVEPSILTESPFILALKADFGKYPSAEEMSAEELSSYCNNVLLEELEFSMALPKIQTFLTSGGEKILRDATLKKKAVRYSV